MCLIQAAVSSTQYSVLVVDASSKIRSRISAAIHADTELTVWGEAGSVSEASNLLEFGLPALALIDPVLPDGSGEKIVTWLNKYAPYVKTLTLTITDANRTDDRRNLNTAVENGASGYLYKHARVENISAGIKQALRGRSTVLSNITRPGHPNTGEIRVSDTQSKSIRKNSSVKEPKLTPAEIDILNYVAKGFTGPEIADMTGRSVNTVPVHMKSIYRKLSVSGRGEAIFRALQLGLIGRE